MANYKGFITVYESSDGGTGDPNMTFWQFFVFDVATSQAVAFRTKNRDLAKTMRLAIETNSQVEVFTDDTTNDMSQAKILFKYICESREIYECKPPEPGVKTICATERYAPCKPGEIPLDNH